MNQPDGVITLEEVERLIRILGMLGSAHDGEVVNAARAAVRWVDEHATDWRTLLTPEQPLAVVSVGVAGDQAKLAQLQAELAAARRATQKAYQMGYDDGQQGNAGKQAKAKPATNTWPVGSWQHVAWDLLNDPATPAGAFRGSKERDFVTDVLGRGYPRLTSAQETWLRDIASRAGMSW